MEQLRRILSYRYLCGNETGLRAYWSFDEGEGTELKDKAGHNTGAIHGPGWVPGVALARPLCDPSNIGLIDSLVSLQALPSTYRTSIDPSGCPGGCTGRFIFDAVLTNNDACTVLSSVVVSVTTLTNGNLLQNADGGPEGAGAVMTLPRSGNSDGRLEPGESVTVPFVICLKSRTQFGFFVSVYGARSVP